MIPDGQAKCRIETWSHFETGERRFRYALYMGKEQIEGNRFYTRKSIAEKAAIREAKECGLEITSWDYK